MTFRSWDFLNLFHKYYKRWEMNEDIPYVPQQKNGQAERGPATQWMLSSLKGRQFWQATEWMDPEDIMLSNIRQTWKNKWCLSPLIQGT